MRPRPSPATPSSDDTTRPGPNTREGTLNGRPVGPAALVAAAISLEAAQGAHQLPSADRAGERDAEQELCVAWGRGDKVLLKKCLSAKPKLKNNSDNVHCLLA